MEKGTVGRGESRVEGKSGRETRLGNQDLQKVKNTTGSQGCPHTRHTAAGEDTDKSK